MRSERRPLHLQQRGGERLLRAPAPKPVPRHDTIRLRVNKGKGGLIVLYMRPDEALAIAAALMTACWHYAIAALGGLTK